MQPFREARYMEIAFRSQFRKHPDYRLLRDRLLPEIQEFAGAGCRADPNQAAETLVGACEAFFEAIEAPELLGNFARTNAVRLARVAVPDRDAAGQWWLARAIERYCSR